MGLMMGLKEAAREAAEGAPLAYYGGTLTQTPQKTPVPTTPSPSSALGVFGSPTRAKPPFRFLVLDCWEIICRGDTRGGEGWA